MKKEIKYQDQDMAKTSPCSHFKTIKESALKNKCQNCSGMRSLFYKKLDLHKH